ncbi:MAG: serine hydrolase [Planctomycetaceae bacterium]|nr:serine hydrolase [Planctomycetaceae bacterium]
MAIPSLAVWLGVATYVKADDGKSPTLDAIDAIVAEGMEKGEMPGAVVLVGTSKQILHFRAYGDRQQEPDIEAMTRDTIFDLASLTKPIATATSVMVLVDQGKVSVTEAASKYLPEFTGHGKEGITLHHLLTHTSGLIADNHLRDYQDGPEQAWERICALELKAEPGEEFIYSDVGFIVLGKLIERVSGRPLNEFAHENIYKPLGMAATGYLPPAERSGQIAPTEKVDGQWRRGVVHDPRSHLLGGVAGHAGLFSHASELSLYAKMILGKGELNGTRILSEPTWELMLTPREVPRGTRAYGWDHRTGYSSNRGEGLSDRAIGHGGFTGTGIWIDPQRDLYYIWLSSRLHPDGKGTVNKLIGRVGAVAAEAVQAE